MSETFAPPAAAEASASAEAMPDSTSRKPASQPQILDIAVAQLRPNRWNRKVFDPQALEELTRNIKAEGIKERLIVRALPDGAYEISAGNRRWLAAQKAGLPTVPCEVRELSDEEIARDNISLDRKSTRLNSSHIPLSR